MKIRKGDGYDDYKVEMSFKELMAFQEAGKNCGDPVADEASKAIEWFFSAGDVPLPGVEEKPEKGDKDETEISEIDALLPDAEIAAPEAPVEAKKPAAAPAESPAPTDDEADHLLPRD